MSTSLRLRLPRPLIAALAAVLGAGTVAAQVIEIGDDGAVVRHDRPAVYLGPEMATRPIAEPTAPLPMVAPAAIHQAITASAAAHGISRALVYAVAWHESRLRADAVSRKGAIGVMQLMPATARNLRVDPYDPIANIEGGTAFLSSLLRRYDGDLVKSLAAYDAGPGAVDRFGGVPPYRETRAYVASILGALAGAATR